MKLIETFAEVFLSWEKDPCNLTFVYSGVLEEIAVSQIVFSLQSKVRSHGLKCLSSNSSKTKWSELLFAF